MVSQLATVSQVGQAVQTNTTLASLLTSSSLSQAEVLVGQDITSADGTYVRPGRLGQCDKQRIHGDAHERDDRVARQRRRDSMTEGDVLDLVQSAIWMVVVGAGPVVGAAMVVGVAIALLQALTQVQEMTLTFVPKLLVVFVVFSLTASFIGSQFEIFTQAVYSHIEHGYRE